MDDERQRYVNENWNAGKSIIIKKKNNNANKATIQDISFFVNEIYKNCIKYDISPNIYPTGLKI